MTAHGDRARSLSWGWQRFVLRRELLLADRLPLGLRLRVPARDDVGRRLYKYGVHEPRVLEWLQDRPAPGRDALALDVGANLGWYSVVLARLSLGALAVHAFEPDPENRALLEENLRLNSVEGVTVSPLALADTPGTARLHRYRAINRGKHSLLPLDGTVDSVAVERARLDDYLADAGLEARPIWLMKLDVEGLEPAVVRGAGRALEHLQALVMEFSPMYYAPGEGAWLANTLAGVGLRPHLHDGERWAPCDARDVAALADQRDTVWVRTSSPPAAG